MRTGSNEFRLDAKKHFYPKVRPSPTWTDLLASLGPYLNGTAYVASNLPIGVAAEIPPPTAVLVLPTKVLKFTALWSPVNVPALAKPNKRTPCFVSKLFPGKGIDNIAVVV